MNLFESVDEQVGCSVNTVFASMRKDADSFIEDPTNLQFKKWDGTVKHIRLLHWVVDGI